MTDSVMSAPLEQNSQAVPKRSLRGLLASLFLGAFNDNIYKMILSLFAVQLAIESGQGGSYVPLIGAIFVLPYLLFSGYAGHLADVCSKQKVLIATKYLEIGAMGLACVAFWVGQIELMLGVLFLMALQSALFSPAKYGILPELVPPTSLSWVNGLVEMSTFLAIILGTTLGSLLFATGKGHLEWVGLILVGIAVVGTVASWRIPKVPPANPTKPLRRNPWGEIRCGLVRLYCDRPLWLTAVGIAYFWFLGALLQMTLILYGAENLGASDVQVGLLQTFLAVGIGVGSLAAGRLSGDKVELGLVPLGAFGMGGSALALAVLAPSYGGVAGLLLGLGFSGGLFIIPLNAFVQQKSDGAEKGQVLATSNFMNTIGILVASGLLWVGHDWLQLAPDRVLLLFGLFTLLGTVYVMTLLPAFFIRFCLWLLTHTIYRIRIVGAEHVPQGGPALLICNHVSFIDGFLVGACIQRFIRFLVYKAYYDQPALNGLFRLTKAIPIAGGDRETVSVSLERAREELRQGHVVCIFAEGTISRTGNLLPFKRGFERILEGLDVPLIPVHLDRVWGSIFSFKDGRFVWKWPRKLPYPVTVSFGAPLAASTTAVEARQAMMELGEAAVIYRRTRRDLLHLRFIATAKRHWRRLCMADATGKELTFGQSLTASLLLASWLRRHCANDERVGLMLPSSVGGALANIAVLLSGKIPVNLNFTAGREAVEAAVAQSDIQTLLTSQQFLQKAPLPGLAELRGLVRLEDVMRQVKPWHKVRAWLVARWMPTRLLQWWLTPRGQTCESLATLIFSSGSTGTPKGVMLTHHNILSNLEGMDQVFDLRSPDRLMGVLPFFHAFGFTVTLWYPLVLGIGVVYHPNPTEAKAIGALVRRYKATLLLSTPTFCGFYLRQCEAAAFASLRHVIVGAERLQPALAHAFRDKFGLDLLEGYGCTEMGPVVSVNVPDVPRGDRLQVGGKPGSVGHPLPGVVARIVDPETGVPLSNGTAGLLLVKSPSRMLGYWRDPERTAAVVRDGWYVTGDIATIDDDGFICITDRFVRFSKIAGEMVPHVKLEEATTTILGEAACVVTGVPDARKGEAL